jgi:hypothetical protein
MLTMFSVLSRHFWSSLNMPLLPGPFCSVLVRASTAAIMSFPLAVRDALMASPLLVIWPALRREVSMSRFLFRLAILVAATYFGIWLWVENAAPELAARIREALATQVQLLH